MTVAVKFAAMSASTHPAVALRVEPTRRLQSSDRPSVGPRGARIGPAKTIAPFTAFGVTPVSAAEPLNATTQPKTDD